MSNTKVTVRFAGLERNTRGIAVRFEMIASNTHGTYTMAECTSGYGFRSYGAAIKGARRAVEVANRTGRFPNMCTRF